MDIAVIKADRKEQNTKHENVEQIERGMESESE